jgi:hypothetical protein
VGVEANKCCLSESSSIISICYTDVVVACFLNINLEDMEGGSVTELWQSDLEIQSLHQYFDLLKTNIKQYENLKKSGAPDIILKDLIDQQTLLLSKVCEELTKS